MDLGLKKWLPLTGYSRHLSRCHQEWHSSPRRLSVENRGHHVDDWDINYVIVYEISTYKLLI